MHISLSYLQDLPLATEQTPNPLVEAKLISEHAFLSALQIAQKLNQLQYTRIKVFSSS